MVMSPEEMDALMGAISDGEVQVTHRSRYEDALPLVEEPSTPMDE